MIEEEEDWDEDGVWEVDEEYGYEYPTTIKGLLKLYITEYLEKLKSFYRKKVCDIKGHRFSDVEELSVKFNKRTVIMQRCRCGEHNYIYADTRERLPEGAVQEIYGIMIMDALHRESAIYKILPKAPYTQKELSKE